MATRSRAVDARGRRDRWGTRTGSPSGPGGVPGRSCPSRTPRPSPKRVRPERSRHRSRTGASAPRAGRPRGSSPVTSPSSRSPPSGRRPRHAAHRRPCGSVRSRTRSAVTIFVTLAMGRRRSAPRSNRTCPLSRSARIAAGAKIRGGGSGDAGVRSTLGNGDIDVRPFGSSTGVGGGADVPIWHRRDPGRRRAPAPGPGRRRPPTRRGGGRRNGPRSGQVLAKVRPQQGTLQLARGPREARSASPSPCDGRPGSAGAAAASRSTRRRTPRSAKCLYMVRCRGSTPKRKKSDDRQHDVVVPVVVPGGLGAEDTRGDSSSRIRSRSMPVAADISSRDICSPVGGSASSSAGSGASSAMGVEASVVLASWSSSRSSMTLSGRYSSRCIFRIARRRSRSLA